MESTRAFYEDYGPISRSRKASARRKTTGKRSPSSARTPRSPETEVELERFVFGPEEERASTVLLNHNATPLCELEFDSEACKVSDLGRRCLSSDGRVEAASEPANAVSSASDVEDELVSLVSKSRRRKLRHALTETAISRQTFEKRLRDQFIALHGLPKWATRHLDSEPEGCLVSGVAEHCPTDSAALCESISPPATGKSERKGKGSLPSGMLPIQRLTDANAAAPSASVLSSVGFHPVSAHLFFTAGLDKRLRLFHVTDEPADMVRWRGAHENECLHTVCFADMPIYTAGFARGPGSDNGRAIYLAGRRRYFYEYDLAAQRGIKVRTLETLRRERSYERLVASPDGKLLAFVGDDSQVILLDAHSKDYVGCIRVGCGPQSGASSVRVVTFAPDSAVLACAGETSGYVSLYDLRMGTDSSDAVVSRPMARFLDQGTARFTALSWSPGGHYLATGSDAGFVHIYDARRLRREQLTNQCGESINSTTSSVAPKYSVSNLVTHIDTLAFLPDDQGLLYASRAKRNAARVVHLGVGKTFSNWPTAQTPLHRVWSASFSPGGGFLALGNDRGRALVYRIRCYGPY
ncbi:hypothetical protein CCYA_CCYA02G0721 [Cyanidiococcus yangmingshanensis]|nr:hypothetical protein CCYA_CCYA02G0721 [Cyanidiococcus yangmingshanensis]